MGDFMTKRETDTKQGLIRFNGDDIALAATMIEKLSTTIDIMYYLMNRREERSFVIMLVSDKKIDVGDIVAEQKRNTDILFKLDENRHIYAIICQDTKIDGGYHFADRVMKHMKRNKAEEPYCVEVEVRTTVHEIKFIVFKLLEEYLKAKEKKLGGEIVFKTLN